MELTNIIGRDGKIRFIEKLFYFIVNIIILLMFENLK